jgi:hypothetical protein
MSSSGDSYLDRARGTSVDDGLRRALLAPILALGSGLSLLVSSGLDSFSGLFEIIGDLREFLGALFTEPIVAIQLASEATGLSAAEFGVAAVPITFASIAIGLVIVDRIFGDRLPIVDSIIPWR